MNFRTFQEKFSNIHPLAVQRIRYYIPGFSLKQLYSRKKQGRLLPLIRGWRYFPKAEKQQGIDFFTANEIYQPSYISNESALRYYGLIPEYVPTITAVTTKKTQIYQTALWNFSYQSCNPRYYRWYQLIQRGEYTNIRIAEPEKALCDYFYFHKECLDIIDIQELRINREQRWNIASNKKLYQYAQKYPVRVQKIICTFIVYCENNA